jgi:hypothetical protein
VCTGMSSHVAPCPRRSPPILLCSPPCASVQSRAGNARGCQSCRCACFRPATAPATCYRQPAGRQAGGAVHRGRNWINIVPKPTGKTTDAPCPSPFHAHPLNTHPPDQYADGRRLVGVLHRRTLTEGALHQHARLGVGCGHSMASTTGQCHAGKRQACIYATVWLHPFRIVFRTN